MKCPFEENFKENALPELLDAKRLLEPLWPEPSVQAQPSVVARAAEAQNIAIRKTGAAHLF
jgi:hypothetical protein